MDSSRWEQIQDLFHQALERPEPERRAFVVAAADGDSEIISEVTIMLGADGRRTSLLDRGLSEVAHQVVNGSSAPASFKEFGPYRIEKLLGEGGMGVVYLAERLDAGNRVAIKFLLHAALSPARRDNFTREIKTLARLKHPFVSRLYDAGSLDDGTPWFAMEYVEGVPLSAYIREQPRSVKERLRLFRSICDAVQYAHSQEIIHRDLKPSNIFVEKDGTPRLLDFGIAKQLQKFDDPTDQTRPALRFFSRDYAAPEWALDGVVGFQTDVYSLGVILYEMLTGRLPGQNPEKPSAAAGGELPLSKSAWSDLDVLCLKAMHPDPGKRYQSVEAVIRDVDHYLNREPLEARPDTLGYRLGKFVERNRSSVIAASLVFALLTGLVVFFTMRLARARDSVLAEAARTQRIERFMENLFEGEDKEAGPPENLRVVTLLDHGVQRAQELKSDPAIQAELYETLGTIYLKLGKFEKSDSLLNSALERRKTAGVSDQSIIAGNILALGQLRGEQARLPEAERLIRQALDIARRRLPPGDPIIPKALAALGPVLTDRGDYNQAVDVLNEALRLQSAHGEANGDVADTLTSLSEAHFQNGKYPESDSLNQRAVKIFQQIYGPRDPRMAENFINLGSVQYQLGNYPQAEQYFRQALATHQSWYGKDNPATARAEYYVAQALAWELRYDESQALLKHAQAVIEQSYGKDHPRVALVLSSLGSNAADMGKLDEAAVDFERMAAIYRSAYGEQHQMTAIALGSLAAVYLKKHEYAEAEGLFREVIDIYNKVLPPGHFNMAIAQARLGRALVSQKRYREAEEHTLGAYEILKKQANPSLDFLQGSRADLVRIYNALGQSAKAAKFKAELEASRPPKVDVPKRK